MNKIFSSLYTFISYITSSLYSYISGWNKKFLKSLTKYSELSYILNLKEISPFLSYYDRKYGFVANYLIASLVL